MPHYVIKPNRDRDEYVNWSTIIEAPICHGNRTTMALHLVASSATGDGHRLDRADEFGTSCQDVRDGFRFYDWECGELIYDQQGTVKRADLYELCERLVNDEPVDDLLTPFEDDEAEAVGRG